MYGSIKKNYDSHPHCVVLGTIFFNLIPRAFSSFKMAGGRNPWPRLLNGFKNS